MRALWLTAALLGCGKDSPSDSNPRDAAYSSDWDGVAAMVEDHCVGCHWTGGQAASLPYPETIQLDVLEGNGDFVVAGDPGQSRLWLVLESGLMPAVGGPLAPYQRDHVFAWIEAGAPNAFGGIDFDEDGFTADTGDCDEREAAVRPSAIEVCGDGLDNDCEGTVDGPDAADAVDWYVDTDADGYGEGAPTRACGPLAGHAAWAGDCDPMNPQVHPGQLETTNGVDDDCDGFVDETTSFAVDVEPLFPSYCSCHVSGLSGVMILSNDPYADLVDVPSEQVPGLDRVEPFDLDASYLWHKLNGTQATVGGSGDNMPQSADPLSASQLSAIQAWILEGAPP